MGGFIHWVQRGVTWPWRKAKDVGAWAANAISHFITLVTTIFHDVANAWFELFHAAEHHAAGVASFLRNVLVTIEWVVEWAIPALVHDPGRLISLLRRDAVAIVKDTVRNVPVDVRDVAEWVDSWLSDVL